MNSAPNKTISPGTCLQRAMSFNRDTLKDDVRTVELAFSSEEPYERYWGVEILDHGTASVRMRRIKDGGPLLMDHNSKDHVGVIESVEIGADRVGRAVVRFGKSARAEEVYQDVKDGIRKHVSVGYMVHAAKLVGTENGIDTYRVTDWEPMEVSLVSVPADHTVGVGRSAQNAQSGAPEVSPIVQIIQATPTAKANSIMEQNTAPTYADRQKEVAEIIKTGEQYGNTKLASECVRDGKSLDEFRNALLAAMATKPLPSSDVGLTKKEVQRYSWMRAINALASPNDTYAQQAAAFEREVSDAVAKKTGKPSKGLFVPSDVQKRDLVVGTPSAGGNTVAVDLLASNFIDLLRNKMRVRQMGASALDGLIGNIAIPRQTGGATAYWVAESGAPTESQQAFDQVVMSPKTVGAFTDISRKLLLQSSIGVESFVQNDLATVLSLAIDLAAINGAGTSDPRGILNVVGIGDVAGGANGLAPTWAHMVDLWTDIAVANADFGSMGVLTNNKVVGKLMSTLKSAGVSGYVCETFPDASGMTSVGGMRVGVSNQVPSNLVKGSSGAVCSAIIHGNWADLIIGMWGGLDLMVDPYTGGTAGTVRIVALQDVDVAVRHPESFSAMKDALTV
jgi:HK97 family phage major capsid protein/HK97 family phage prohead protease